LHARAVLLVVSLLLPFGVWAQMCAAPGNDGAGAATGVVNDYFPGAGASTLAAGSTSLTLGTQRTGAANKTLAANDLLLVIQMQDASINAVNSSAYGSGGSGGQGSTSVGSTGLYEFVRVVSVSSGVVSFSPALTNTYRNAAATATSGQKTYQIVRVPQYTSASVSGVTAPPWNGATGGVVAIDARDVLTLNGATVENQANRAIFLAGKGFRGAVGSNGASRGSRDDWMGDYSSAGGGGGKGEGIAGTPRYLANKVTAYGSKLVNAVASGGINSVDNTAEGYPGGSRARGAPGNAGGGGADGAPAGTNNNQYNSGGGGGGNYAAGGVGGRPWNYPLVDSGGRGGGGYVGTTAFNRIFLGGGGGAGGTNDGTADNNAYGNNGIACADTGGRCSSGASGGGIVILRAQSVTGTGVIDVRGANGYNVQNDAAGGGGAGGSVIIHSVEGGSAVIDASGGDGGNAWAGNQTNAANRHGPGGGGGGGFIAFSPSSMSVTTTINGGTPGYTTNGTTDNYGAFGNQGGIASFQSPNVPGTLPGASCAVDLRLTKSNGVNIVNAGGQTTYTLTASNVGASPTTGTVTIVDKLPQGVTIPAGSLPLTGANAANWSCSGAAGSRLITCTSATAIPAAGSSVFGVTVNIGLLSATGPTATNKAKIGGGGDPLNSTAPTEAAVDACTGNQSPAGCALDVDAVNSPLLSLTNTDNTDVVLAGGTTTYTLTVNNVGNAPTAGTVTVVNALPTGMAYTGAASFTSGVFSCSYTSSSNSVSCTTSSVIAAGASAAISLPVSIASTAPSALVNLASVGGGSDSSKPNAPTVASTQSCSPAIASEIATGCAADTDAVKRVQLSLTKDDGRFGIYVGGTTTYAFRVSNTGDTASVGTINFRDVLPGPMNWPATLTKTGANAADWTCTRLSATEVSCTSAAPIAAGGVSQFSLLANAGAMTSGTQYMNKARVGGGGDATLATAAPTADQVNACTNNSIPAGCAIDLNTAQTPPTLRLTKTHADPQSKAPGAAVAFTLTVANTGAEALANTVRVVDVFPAGLSNVTVAATQGIFSCAMGSGADSNVLTCNNTAGALAANASASIAVTATVSATTSTTLVNKAQVGTDNTDPSTSSYPTSTTAAACTALNTPTAGCATDSVPVVPSATLTVVSSVNARAASTDQFTVGISNGGPSATTAGTATSVSTAGFAVTPGTSYVLSETAAGTTNLARYTTSYACTNATAGGTAVAPGTGTTLTLTLTPQAGDAITCTFTNTPIAPRLTLAKSIVSRALASDQFTVAISNGGPSASTTGTSTTASTTVFTATAGTSYTLSESALAGANLSRYTSSYSCSNAGVAGTVMPSGTGTSFSLAPQAGDNINCTFSNTAIAPRLTVNTVVAGRLLSTDQFTVGISNGGPSATTTGTQTTASAGPTTATAGTSYLLTETAAGTPATNLARYTTTYSCTNATAGGTSVGSGTGTSITVVPQAGDDISCTFTNTPVYPKLSVTKAASPGSFVAGASGQSYRITIGVANGPTTAAISIADSLPTGVTLSGVPTVSGGATLSGCSTSGSTIGACQLASGLANGSYVVTIPVSVAASATSTGAANTANLGGGGDPSCTAAATTEACDPTTGAVAVKTPANVGLVKSGAATAVAGNSYVYTLALSNSGQTATSSNLVVRDQLAPGMVATAVTGANCGTLPSAAGALLSCTVAEPVAADGGTASIQLTVTMPSGGGNVVNYAATHPSGSGNPGVDPGPACTNAANVVCASATTASSTPANVSLSKTGAATALTGSSYVYTLTLSNSGQLATGSNPIIKDQLPAGVVATSVSGASCGTLPSSAAALLTCTLAGPVAAGASATVQLTVTLPNAGGTLVNNAATNPTGSGAPGVDPSATCVNSATTFCASHSLAVNTPASLATTNVLTSVNGSPVPAGYLAKPGDVLTYTVTVVNSGGTAGSTDVGQTVPAGTTYTGSGQGWSAGCTDAGTQCTQTVPVGANQTSTVQYTVTVASPGGTATIVDTATSSVGTCTACQVSTDTQRADMQASISVSPGTTSATGVELTYTSICKNNGPQTALNAACTVSAPAGAATTCTPASPAATLASGSSITCTTKLTPGVVGDYAVSVATSNTLFDPATGNNSATATVKVNTPAALRIVKSLAQVNGAAVPANYAAKIGDTLTYAMVVTNTGGTAGTTVLTETVPEGTQFVGGNAPDLSQGWSQAPQACDAAASICTQTVSVPAQSTDGVPGQQTVQFTVKVLAPATSNGKITNTVASDVAAACASGTCAVETANAVADMQAQISSIPATAVVVGQSVTITGTCTNNGPADAVNASCAMAVNNAGTSIAGTCASNADLAMGATNLSCSATFVAAEGAISATIHATTQSYESNTANNTDTKSTVGNTPASLATTNVLTAVNGSPVPAGYLAKPGDVLTYTVSVTNSGGTAGSTEVGQTVPAGTTYTGTGQGWGAGCAAAGTQCAQPVSVGAGQTSTLQYTVTVASPGSIATIVDTVTSSVGTCTACQVTTGTQQADMQATVTVTPGAISTTGVELIYTSVCKNNGPQTALNAACAVTAPAGAQTICTPTSPAATLASGTSITCTTKFTPSVAGDYAVSVATSNDLYDAAPGNNTANATVKVNTPADLHITKTLAQVNGAAVPANYAAKIGDKLTYAMVVTNTGGTAGTTVLTETVPEGTQFVGVSSDPTQGWSEAPQKCEAAGTTCVQSVNVPAQSAEGAAGEKTVEFTVEVIAPATSNGKITNTVLSDVATACAGTNCAVETANAVADMQAQITDIPATAVVVGQSVTISGVCTNSGPANAVNASCQMAVSNGGTSIAATCGANANLAMSESISCSVTFIAAEGAISATIHTTTQSYESNTANNTDTKSTVGNTPASLATTNVLTLVNGSPVPAGYLAKPGDVLTYTVSVTNSGGTAGSTEVGQTVPAGTTYTGTGQGWGASCTAAGTQCAQPVSVGAGQTSTVSYTVTVSSPGSTPTIVNTATSSVGSCTTCVVTTNTQQADMAAAVTVTPGAISTTGVELTYTAVCKNNGPQAALNASCVVSAPAGASAAICTPTSPAATLASGDSITCVTKLTPSSAGDYAVSVATGNDLYDAAPANNTANSSVKVNTPAALSIVKSLVQVNGADATAGYAAKIGDKLTYAMVVTNTGGTAGTTVLTETVPEGTQFVGGGSSDPTQGWSELPQKCEAAGTSCEQSVNVPAQSADGVASERTVQFTVEVVAPATTNGKITNTVASDMAAACAGTHCSVETSNAVADMQAQITSMPAGAVVVGDSVTITGVCTNNGPASAASASCAMVVSNGGASITATCDAAKTLAVNETLSCSATFVAVQGDISASVSAATQSYESDKTNNTDSKSTVGNTPASLATTNVLTAVNGSPVPANYLAKPGDVLTYTVSVTNSGGTAGSTEVGQTVPAGTTYTGTGQGWGAGCAAAGTQCAQPVTVAAGQTSTLQYTVTVASPGSIATIVDTVSSSVGTCTACQVTTGTQQADMQATVTVTPGTTSTTGVELVYTAVCKNNGPQSAINAACVVIAPANAVTTCAPTTPAATLASGSSITCTTKLTPSAADDYAVSVTASNALYDAAPGNNTANATVKVSTPADLHITKTLAQANGAAVPANYAAKIGDKLTYAMLVTNTGGTAGTTVLTETVPEGTQFVGVSSDPTQGWSEAPGACLAAASTCTQSVTVPAQSAEGAAGEKTVEFTVEVIAPATSNGKITNTVLSDVAAACTGTSCSVETNNAVADMQAQITDIPAAAVVVGQSVTITGVCTNKGPADAVNASCEMTVNNGGNSIPASCGANVNLALNESISCTASFTAVEGAISASIRTATQSYESNTANNTDTKSTVGNTAASLVTTNVLTAVNGNPVPAGYLAKPGDVLTYTVTVANTGGTAGSTDVGQTVPAGTSYTGTGEGWSAGCAAASSTCNQTVAVGAGQTSSVTYTVTVAGPGSTATIVNTATSSVGSCSACQVTTGTQRADMQATVAVTPGPTSTTGVELVYTSVCKNQGPQSALNASCIVTAPANAVTTCAPVSPVATLESGESITCTTKFTPSDAGDYAVSVATSNTLYDPAAGNNTATKTVKVNTPAELNIAKTLAQVNGAAVPDNYAAKIGDTLTYHLRVTNAGGTASTLELTETVPEGTRFVGGAAANPDQGWSLAPHACDAAASTCMQSVTVPAQSAGAPGEQTVQFTVEVLAPATSSGKIINTVTSDVPAACAAGGCTAETANAVADMQAQITTIPSGAVVVGDSVTITGQCTNNGPVEAVNASCVMTVNNGGNSIAATCGANTQLAVGESISCTATFTAAEGSISASMTAATDSYESDTANNTATQAVNGNTPSAVTVRNVLVKVNDAPVPAGYVIKPGDKLTYQVLVSNTGGTPGSTVLTETVPVGTRYAGTDEGWTAGCGASRSTCNRSVTVPGGSAQAPGTVAFEYTVRVEDTVSSPNVVNIVDSSAPGSCSAACSVSTPTQAADMQVSMPATIDAKVGVEFTLTSVCRNAGPATASNARCDVSGAPAGAVTVCTPTPPIASLAVGESVTCTTRFTPSSTAAITITTRASSDVYDPVAANSEASASAVFTSTPPAAVKAVPVNAAWATGLVALLLMLLAGRALPHRQGRGRQN